MHGVSRFMYLVTRSSRFLAGSVLKLMNTQTTLRLHWVIKNNEALSEAIRNKTAMFGTLDSWLLYKLRKGTSQNKYVEHISDITSCSATGFYDPFSLNWADWALKLFSINVRNSEFKVYECLRSNENTFFLFLLERHAA